MTLASKRLGMKLLVWLILFTILTVNLTSDLKASSTSTGFNLTHNFRVQEITTKGLKSTANSRTKVAQNPTPERESWLLIQTNTELKKVILNKHKLSADVSFSSYYARLTVFPSQSVHSVTMNSSPTRVLNYTLGLGSNVVDIGLSTGSTSAPPGKRNSYLHHYIVSINRENRIYDLHLSQEICYLEQDCGLKIYDKVQCGLQRWSPNSQRILHHSGYWKISCGSCNIENSCVWDKAEWVEPDSNMSTPQVPQAKLKACLENTQVLFLGDSTNRGIMQTVTERLNTTLTEAVKSHGYFGYQNIGQATSLSFMYYPPFWLHTPPTFNQSLYSLLNKSKPSIPKHTILVIGGVQWVAESHLLEISKFIIRERIPAKKVYIKTHSSGFLLNVPGIPLHHDQKSLKKLIKRNEDLSHLAHKLGFHVIDTLKMTLSRYREFSQGKCACHFHQVQENRLDDDITDLPASKSSLLSRLYKLGLVEETTTKPTTYHIAGNIHNTYTDMLVDKMCGN